MVAKKLKNCKEKPKRAYNHHIVFDEVVKNPELPFKVDAPIVQMQEGTLPSFAIKVKTQANCPFMFGAAEPVGIQNETRVKMIFDRLDNVTRSQVSVFESLIKGNHSIKLDSEITSNKKLGKREVRSNEIEENIVEKVVTEQPKKLLDDVFAYTVKEPTRLRDIDTQNKEGESLRSRFINQNKR